VGGLLWPIGRSGVWPATAGHPPDWSDGERQDFGLAFELATRFPCDIVSVDSAQVFRDMNVGTAKPDAATLARFPHRLIDLITPEQRYSAAQFRADALREMASITAAGRIPLLVGGTMLYVKALREGLADLPPGRRRVARRKSTPKPPRAAGRRCMRNWRTLDPETAARLKPTDAQRIQRALEVVRLSGRSLGSFFAEQAASVPPFRLLNLALVPDDRSLLHRRIEQRFDAMLNAGLVEEVLLLREKYRLAADLPSMRCVGYRQVWDMLEGTLPRAELRDRGVFATRQFAKRQLTWLRSIEGLTVVDPLAADAPARVLAAVERHLA
jgi:tRNA dimethylallyltransferase